MSDPIKQIFGYSPIEEFQNTDAWRTERRASLSPLVDAQISYLGQQETNKANAELAQKQNDFNLMMWEKQNAYNSPVETMKRLTDAGINPRAFQQIGQFANADSPKPAERPDYDSPLGKLARFTDKAQIDLARQKLLLDKINMSKEIATALTDKILSYQQLGEIKRHNKEIERVSIGNYNLGVKHNDNERMRIIGDLLGNHGILVNFDGENGQVTYEYNELLKNLPVHTKQAIYKKLLKEIEVMDTKQVNDSIGSVTGVGNLLLNILKAILKQK